MGIQSFSSVILICSNREWLTFWMNISHSCQWFQSTLTESDSLSGCIPAILVSGSAQTLERNSPSGCIFSHPCQYFWFTWTMERWLTYWTHVQSFLSVVLICSITKEKLTSWIGVQSFSSVVLIWSNTKEWPTCWIHDQPFSSVVLIFSNNGEQLTPWPWMHDQPFLSVVLICSYTKE